jgi:death-on-curing protein
LKREPWSAWITETLVYELHQRALAEHGGRSGRRSEGCVSGALGNAWSAQLYEGGGEDDPPNLFVFAVRLFLYLLRNHCFVDGNKRVAWLALDVVLRQEELTIDETDEAAEAFVRDASENAFSDAVVVEWLSARLAALDKEDR